MAPPQRGPLHAAAQPALQHIGRSYLRLGRPPRQSAMVPPFGRSKVVACGAAPQQPASCARSILSLPKGPPRPAAQPPTAMPPTAPGTSCLFSHPACLGDLSSAPLARPLRHPPLQATVPTARFGYGCPGRDGPGLALPPAGSRVKNGSFDCRPLPFWTRAPVAGGKRHVSVLRSQKPDGIRLVQGVSGSFRVIRAWLRGWVGRSRPGQARREGHQLRRRGAEVRALAGVPIPCRPPPLAFAARQRLTPRRPAEGPTHEKSIRRPWPPGQ